MKKVRFPLFSKGLVLGSVISLIIGCLRFNQSQNATKQIEYRKKQLKKPILKLSKQDIINPPWNYSNIDQWLYRRVQFLAIPDYNKIFLWQRKINDQNGYQVIIPYRVDNQQNYNKGLLVGKGFVPLYCQEIPDSGQKNKEQKVFGIITRLSELKMSTFDLFTEREYSFKQTDKTLSKSIFKKQIEASSFDSSASIAIIQNLRQTGIIDQNLPKKWVHQNQTINQQSPPFCKTQTGALQLRKMPDQLALQGKLYIIGGTIGGVLSALLL